MKTNQLLTWAVLIGVGYFAYKWLTGEKPCLDCNKTSKTGEFLPENNEVAVQPKTVKKVVDFAPEKDVNILTWQEEVIN